MKKVATEDHVRRRLKELLAWADYIAESLVRDQGYESGKVEQLTHMLGEPALKELREAAWTLRENLDRVRIKAERFEGTPAGQKHASHPEGVACGSSLP